MALTGRIEKAILSGWATYRKINHSFGSFGSIAIPKGHTAIILDVSWNHFFDLKFPEQGAPWNVTIGDLIKYSQYQLKIDGKKSVNFLEYNNIIKLQNLNPNLVIDANEPFQNYIDNLLRYIIPIHSQPTLKDVFFICENYKNLTKTKNVFINKRNTNYNGLNPLADQQPEPNGLGNSEVILEAIMESPTGNKFKIIPPTQRNAQPLILPTPPNNFVVENYTHPIEPKQSNLSNFKGNFPYFYNTQPLIELGIVIFNSNDFDKIANQ